MSTARKVRPITVEEYLEGEKVGDIRHEFVGGEIFPMVGASEAHNLIAGAFQANLYMHLRGTACRALAGTMKLRRGNDLFYPDVFVACGRTGDGPYFKTRPLLIVEVLSPGTAVRLGRCSGNRPQLWLDLQARYDVAVVERDHGAEIARQVRAA